MRWLEADLPKPSVKRGGKIISLSLFPLKMKARGSSLSAIASKDLTASWTAMKALVVLIARCSWKVLSSTERRSGWGENATAKITERIFR